MTSNHKSLKEDVGRSNACVTISGQFRWQRFLNSGKIKSLTSYFDLLLLSRTIVIVTGDHGEEFMERSRWGHNSSFFDEQAGDLPG